MPSLIHFLLRLRTWLWRLFGVLLFMLLVAGSTLEMRGVVDQVRMVTRAHEFNYLDWTLDALLVKAGQFAAGTSGYVREDDRVPQVRQYFDLLEDAFLLEYRLAEMMADPAIDDPQAAAHGLIQERNLLRDRLGSLQPVVEAILGEQAGVVLAEEGIEFAGAPFPPIAFQFTKPPVALIVSPRHVIRQDANISMDPGLTLEEIITLEKRVERGQDVSALIVPIGGVGIYPTMISESTSVEWITEVILHEWVHNYLTLHPLGLNYETSPELRTMNETTANLLGKELGRRVLERYYPELVPPPPVESISQASGVEEPPAFDFRAEMRDTRVTVEAFLAEGRIEEAEAYMEMRREIFWQNGHHIRRLNQAYFAFYGAYADEPGGAAGEDPVGSAVRQLWSQIDSPMMFLRTMAWMNDFSDLLAVLES